LMGIRVVKTDRSPIDTGTTILREIGYYISIATVIGLLWAMFDADNQTWHDKIAGTYVVRA
jgi:uncharacterized RDD family membrane protein YckC